MILWRLSWLKSVPLKQTTEAVDHCSWCFPVTRGSIKHMHYFYKTQWPQSSTITISSLISPRETPITPFRETDCLFNPHSSVLHIIYTMRLQHCHAPGFILKQSIRFRNHCAQWLQYQSSLTGKRKEKKRQWVHA